MAAVGEIHGLVAVETKYVGSMRLGGRGVNHGILLNP